MDKDLTSFWLAWRKTCAIRTCCSEESLSLHNRQCKTASDRIAEPEMKKVSEDAKWVMEVTNGYFAKMIRTPRSVKALKKYAERMAAERAGCPGEPEDGGRSDAEDLEDSVSPDPSERLEMDVRRDDTRHFKDGPSLADTREDEDDAAIGMRGAFRVADKDTKRGKMISEYRDLVYGWDHHDRGVTSAFELVEMDLYREAAEQGGSADSGGPRDAKLNGKKLKDYLFEDIGGRPGGVCKNLWGYLLKENPSPWGVSRLRMVANQSFRNPVVEETPSLMDDGRDRGELPDPDSKPFDEPVQVLQAGGAFRDYLAKRWMAEFDVTDRVSICCAFFEYVMSDPFVAGLVPVGMSAFNARKTKRVSEIYSFLKDAGYDFDTVRTLFCGDAQEKLFDIAVRNQGTRDPVCLKLVMNFESHRKRWEKELKSLAENLC